GRERPQADRAGAVASLDPEAHTGARLRLRRKDWPPAGDRGKGSTEGGLESYLASLMAACFRTMVMSLEPCTSSRTGVPPPFASSIVLMTRSGKSTLPRRLHCFIAKSETRHEAA